MCHKQTVFSREKKSCNLFSSYYLTDLIIVTQGYNGHVRYGRVQEIIYADEMEESA